LRKEREEGIRERELHPSERKEEEEMKENRWVTYKYT